MSDNFTVLDGNGAPRVLRSTDNAGVHTPHQKVDALPGTVEADIGNTASRLATIVTALGSYLATLAGTVTSNRVAVELTVAVTGYLSALASAAGSAIAQDRTAAAAPSATRLSTGAAFYDAAKTGQLPTTLGQATAANSLSVVHASDDVLISDILGSSVALGALNAASSAGLLKGKRSAGFLLSGGGSLVGTLTAECFVNAYTPTLFYDPLTGVTSPTLTVSSPVSDIIRGIILIPGTTNLRVKVTAYTSGTSNGAVALSNADPVGLLLQSLAPATTVYDGSKNVTTAGTRVVLASSQALTKGVRVRAKDANTGLIYVGGASVSSSSDRLAPGEPTWMDVNNLANVWIDAAVSGEGVTFSGW